MRRSISESLRPDIHTEIAIVNCHSYPLANIILGIASMSKTGNHGASRIVHISSAPFGP